jgi:hypothetical protein
MKNHILRIVALYVVSTFACGADKFVIHDREITIQAPEGFVLVTDEMPEVKKIVEQISDNLNDTIAYYIPESQVPAAMGSGTLDLRRTFAIKADKRLRKEGVSNYLFPYHKDLIRSQIKKTTQEVKSKLPKHLDVINDKINEGSDLKIALSVSQVVPLDIHHEDTDSISYSMFINYGFSVGEYKDSEISAVTCTVSHVKDSMILLLSYAPKDELEKTRSSSLAWNAQISKDNKEEESSIAPISNSYTQPIKSRKEDNYLITLVIVGMLVAICLALVVRVFKRER